VADILFGFFSAAANQAMLILQADNLGVLDKAALRK